MTALATKDDLLKQNSPDTSQVFSMVNKDTGLVELEKTPEYYRVLDVEHGTLERAGELVRSMQTRHAFNGKSILKNLEETGVPFNIVRATVLDEVCLSKTKYPERAHFFILTPKL